jgi:hypothetical protein
MFFVYSYIFKTLFIDLKCTFIYIYIMLRKTLSEQNNLSNNLVCVVYSVLASFGCVLEH